MTTHTSRRNFLRGTGGILVALPLLESIGTVRAGQRGSPLRYLQLMHPQGTLANEWSPSGAAKNMVLSEILSPLQDHIEDIVVVSNCDNLSGPAFGSNGHINSGRTVFTCAPNSGNSNLADGPSIDQVIADRIAAPTPHRTLQFGIGGASVSENQALYAGPQDPVPVDADPTTIFTQLFSSLKDDPLTAPTTIARLHARRASVLDGVLEQFNATMGAASTADRETLERHADKIRELEIQVGNTGNAGIGCATPNLQLPNDYDHENPGHDDVSSRVLIDLMVMAMACDLTRVGTLQYTSYQEPRFPWLGAAIPGDYSSWHSMVHELGAIDDLTVPRSVFRWYMEEYAYLLNALADTPDGDGSLLDHMLVMSISEMSNGAWHSTDELPIVLAGGVNGALETGRHVDVDHARTGELYLTFLNWFGANDTVFGTPEFCDGPISL
ncbi:MAG: DUF1552 domain-containing protein [Nannocystaceae bacterium]|nr:DUF1552 domain-containing protein [Nannocystaceae bacterium]